jgi:predicted GNAT family N-acyltransferase
MLGSATTMGVSVRILSWAQAAPEAASIRTQVFVVEQGVPPDIELDALDERCEHAVARDSSGRAVGTGRLLPDGHIGRMAVLPEARGAGVGSAILIALLERARSLGLKRVELSSQTRAARFYERHGFAPCGEQFMEAGIPHVPMARAL